MRNRLDVHRNSQGPSALTIDGLRTFELRIASLTMSLMQQTSKNIPSLIHIPNKRLNMFLPPKKPSKSSKIGAVFLWPAFFARWSRRWRWAPISAWATEGDLWKATGTPKKYGPVKGLFPSRELTYPPDVWHIWRWWFSELPQVGYVNFLEGNHHLSLLSPLIRPYFQGVPLKK